MLALTRFADESVMLMAAGRRIGRIKVYEIHGDKVRLAFDLPSAIAVHRDDARGKAPAASSASAAAQRRLDALLDLYPLSSGTTVAKHMHEVVSLLTGGHGDAA